MSDVMASLISEINSCLEKELPRIAVSTVVKEKLEECGIYDDHPLLEALTLHILNNPNSEFKWHDNKYDDITISLRGKDFENVIQKLERFLKEEVKGIINSTIEDSAKSLCLQLRNNWPEQKIIERSQMNEFRDLIDLHWSKSLDPLRMLLTIAREVNDKFQYSLFRSKAKTGKVRRRVVILLHLRACQTTMEIISLLENGLADGAQARWRTLYELGIVASLIDTYGDDIAQRYLDHDSVAMKRAMENALEYDKSNRNSSVSKKLQREINTEYNAMIKKYGVDFRHGYGWATNHLGKKNPTFQDLEMAANSDALPPTYKWASFKIHAGVSGLLRNLGNMWDDLPTLAGASIAGLQDPATNTAYSLTQITALLYRKTRKLENLIEIQTLCNLRDQVEIESSRAAKKLEQEEKDWT